MARKRKKRKRGLDNGLCHIKFKIKIYGLVDVKMVVNVLVGDGDSGGDGEDDVWLDRWY